MKKLLLLILLLPALAWGGTSSTSLSKGLIAYWPLTNQYEDATYEAKDATPYGNHGNAVAAPVVGATYTTFDGTDTQRMQFTAQTYDVDGSTYSFSFWAKRRVTTNYHGVLGYAAAGGNLHWIDFTDSATTNELRIEGSNGDQAEGTLNSADTNWHHYVITCNSGTVAMYQDLVSMSMADSTIESDITLDQISGTNTNSYEFDGNLAHVRIYDRVLSAAEISLLYNNGNMTPLMTTTPSTTKGLIAHWPLTDQYEDATYEAKDATPYGRHGDANGAPVVGTTYTSFDATDGQRFDFPAMTFTVGASQYSFSFWAKRNTVDGIHGVLGYSLAATTSASWIWFHFIGRLYFEINDAVGNDWAWATLVDDDTDWHHYVVTVNAGTVAMYQDSSSLAMGLSTVTNNLVLDQIGVNKDDSYEMAGNLAHVRIYDRVLSAAEISLLYNNGTIH